MGVVEDAGVRDLLSNTALETLLRPRNVASVTYDSTVDEVLGVLAENRILSAPVLSGEAAGVEERDGRLTPANALGFVDIWDILCSFLEG